MKFAFPVSLLLLLGSIALTAQTSGQTLTGSLEMPPEVNNCSILLHVEQAAAGVLLDAKDKPHKGIGQKLYLTISNPDSKHITRGTVIVHGLTDKGRVTQTLSNQNAPSEISKTLTVKFSAESNKADSGYLWAPGMTSVQSVDLKSVTYADGSTWKHGTSESCRFHPDGVMLIDQR